MATALLQELGGGGGGGGGDFDNGVIALRVPVASFLTLVLVGMVCWFFFSHSIAM